MPAPTRTLVDKLAGEIRAGKVDPEAELERAWVADDAESVATYALAAAVADKPLPAARVLDAVVLLDDLLLGALLAANVTGDRVKALLDAVERDDTTDERDALALYLAVILRKRRTPPSLVSLLRTHARRGASEACGELLVAAAEALDNKEVRAIVAESFPDVTVRQALEAVKSLRSAMDGPILEVLPDFAPESLAAPIPIRRTGVKAGRNDPCPCGSGKKYKKCCQDKDATAGAADPQAAWREQLRVSAPTLTAQQVADLRLADLASLPYEQLSAAARVAAFRQLLSHRRWDAAERVLEAVVAHKEDDAQGLRIELVDQAFRSRSLEVARKHAEALREAGVVDPLIEAMLSVATPARGSLSKLDAIAEKGLREDPVALLDISDALLAYYPALGVVATRGALVTARAEEAEVFLELVEEARDKLNLPPGDPASDVYAALERFDRESDAPDRQAFEELASEARALRAASREASGRVQELEARLREQKRDPGAAALPPPAAWESERRELRDRVGELKSLVAEGNAERAQLRRQLTEAAERPREDKPAAPVVAPAPEEDADSEAERAPAEAPRVRGTMVPRFDTGAETSMKGLPARVVRDALRVIADLCSGEGNVWREIKQLERISPPMYSARVGIHYRILFRMEPGVLDVAEVIAREGLITAVRRFWR